MFHARKRRERKLSMLTQGALRQRRRRALESAEERRDRLARDAERKRIKRMSESAEEAAWRRTVDAMRKKEKRMKDRETKAIMAQYGVPTECAKMELSSVGDAVTRVMRPFPSKRRKRHCSPCVGDYFLSLSPGGVADVTEYGGSLGTTANLCDVVNGIVVGNMPSTSRGTYNNNASYCSSPDDEIQRKAHCVASGLWCSDAVTPLATSNALVVQGVGRGCRNATFAAAPDLDTAASREELADSGPDESLSALSPEVIISELKVEPREDEEDDLSDDRMRETTLSALSPEVIIRELRVGQPSGGNFRREPRIEDVSGHQLRGEWIASSAVTVNAITSESRSGDGQSAAICRGCPREDFMLTA
ncbi:uncharacterized protein [Hetaerina americana]|uniref:uncharacterized protein n=1 Tax=Hetaerina americana TaxID=62018 RepID=UPI003A7F2301